MTLSQIEQKVIKPLSRADKLLLIADISMMLQEEEKTDSKLSQYFEKGNINPVFTPLGMEIAAAKLQEYIDNGEL